MKKLIAAIITTLVLTASAWAQPNLTVTYIGISAWGGSYPAYVAQVPPMTRAEVVATLGAPTRVYGYLDIWVGFDMVYLGYYNFLEQPVAIVILPVTSW
jgi:hypothetical protein